jgi:hypothetical protein
VNPCGSNAKINKKVRERDSMNDKSFDSWYTRAEWFKLDPAAREKIAHARKKCMITNISVPLDKQTMQTKRLKLKLKQRPICQVDRRRSENHPSMYRLPRA